MPVPHFTTTCLSNRIIARDIYEFRLHKPEGFSLKAGQFVLFPVALPEHPADVQTRAFSIASAPHEKELLFVAKMKEGGRASRWIAETLKAGSEVSLQGPFGFFTLQSENPKEYLLACTSTGVAPFRGQILDALTAGDHRRIDLLYAVRSEEDLFWSEELLALSREHEHFHLHITLSQPGSGWTGHRGRVQEVLPRVVADISLRQIYICGNPTMTMEMKKMCLEQWGMDRKDVHVEGYI